MLSKDQVMSTDLTTRSKKSSQNLAVQGTNDSSVVSKWSAADVGYVQDEVIEHFVSKYCRRSPLINRGYWIRYKTMDTTLNYFENRFSNAKLQIISLGAGFDSTYFRLKSLGRLQNCIYIEIDFMEVAKRKAKLIETSQLLPASDLSKLSFLPQVKEYVAYCCDSYYLLGLDLTKFEVFSSCLHHIGLNYSLPTLFTSEVVLTYLSAKASNKIISWASECFTTSMFVTYEQILPSDGFGYVMMSHFKKIGSPLRSIQTYPTILHETKRYIEMGWPLVSAVDLNYFLHLHIDVTERSRINDLEPFDELEEWLLKCQHYILLCAYNGACWLDNFTAGIPPYPLNNNPMIQLRSLDYAKNKTEGENFLPCHFYDSSMASGMSLVTYNQALPEIFGSCEPPLTLLCSTNNPMLDGHEIIMEYVEESFLSDPSGWCRCYGHSCCRLSENVFITAGGFGEYGSKHRRQPDVTVTDIARQTANRVHLLKTNQSSSENLQQQRGRILTPMERLYHSCTPLTEDSVLVFGGRSSPLKAFTDTCLLSFKDNLTSVTCTTVTCENSPQPRWRHSAIMVTVSDVKYLLVYGGKTQHNSVLCDVHVLNTHSWHWTQLQSPLPPRCSHSITKWKENSLIVSGGVNEHFIPQGQVWVVNVSSDKTACDIDSVTELPVTVDGRCSHSSFVNGDTLYLLGGVGLKPLHTNIVMVNLLTNCVGFMTTIPPVGHTILLHNHQVVILDKEACVQVYVIGGGGNCFSFGTHLNRGFYKISIPKH